MEREVLTLDDKKYYLDSVSEDGKRLISNIDIIHKEMQRIDIQMNIARIAYDKLLSELKEMSESFEQVQDKE